MNVRILLFSTLGLAAACAGSADISGGSVLRVGHEPTANRIGIYSTSECHDASGAPAARATTVEIVEAGAGRTALVERRAGYDSLLVDNSFADGADRVYAVVLEASGGRRALHEWRMPANGGPGRLSVARRWKEAGLPGGGFRSSLEAPVLICALVPGAGEPPSASPAEGRRPQMRPSASRAEGRRPQMRPSTDAGDARQSALVAQDSAP